MAEVQKPPTANTSKNQIWIGCRLVHGLNIDIRELVDIDLGNGKMAKQYGDIKERRVLRGTGTFTLPNKNRKFQPDKSLMFTDGKGTMTLIDKDFWDEALKESSALRDLVKRGMVYVADSKEKLVDMTAERANLKTGFEQFDPSTDPQFNKIKKFDEKEQPTGKE